MNTLVPVEIYNPFYYYAMILVIMIVLFQAQKNDLQSQSNLNFFNNFGLICMTLIILYLGTRPINGHYFGDMRTYAQTFEYYSGGEKIKTDKDVYFDYFIRFCSTRMSAGSFFFICAFVYVVPLYLATKKIFKKYWFYAFLVLVVSLTFWDYGTNAIRNGLSSSFFLLAVSRTKKTSLFLLMLLALVCHRSIIIPITAFVFTYYYKDTRWLLWFWIFTIPMSLVLGGFWEGFFLRIGFGDADRYQDYLIPDEELVGRFSHTGFRWDFLIYSAFAVFIGWFFIFKKKFEDPFYTHLFNVFLIVNGFWILIIRANFSNRFAYLSWFMIGIIVIYPFLKNQFYHKQHIIIGRLIVAYFIVTFVLNVLLANEK